MKDGFKDRFLRWFTFFVLTVIIVGGSVKVWPRYRTIEDLRRQNAELLDQIHHTRQDIEKLQEYQRRFRTDPDFVEMIARQNHRVFPGELVFIFEGK